MSREDTHDEERERLLAEVEAEFRDTEAWTGRAAMSPAVRAALARVPRHAFVPAADADLAYANIPLPIGHGQTISQPYIVAVMTELLDIGPGDAVLEIGAGSGYQLAVLAEIAARVYGVEVVDELAERARERLAGLGYDNMEIRTGDGWQGWPEHAPYEAIMVTAAATEVPPPLVEQLAPGGRMVIPLGRPWMTQELVRVTKDADGAIEERRLLPVAFVPLIHE